MQSSHLFGLEIVSVTKNEFCSFLKDHLSAKEQNQTISIFTPNPEQVVLAKHNSSFAKTLSQADYLLPDGIGLVKAAAILNFFGKTKDRIKERIAGVDVVAYLLALAKEKQLKILIIGGRDYRGAFEGEAFEDKKSLIEVSPNVFWTEAYQEKAEILPVEEQALTEIIESLKPNLVFVALGAPDQEEWIIRHFDLLKASQTQLAMAVGGSFDFIFAKVKRAPSFMQKLGLEWLWRLIKQPWRRHRQLRLIEFIYLLLREIF